MSDTESVTGEQEPAQETVGASPAAEAESVVEVVFPVVCTGNTALSGTVRFTKGERVDCATPEEQGALLDYQVQTTSDPFTGPKFTHYFAVLQGLERGEAVASPAAVGEEPLVRYLALRAAGQSDDDAATTVWGAAAGETQEKPAATGRKGTRKTGTASNG